MAARSSDYEWIRSWKGGVSNSGYCLTIVKGRSPDQVLDRLQASSRLEGLTVDDVAAHCWKAGADSDSMRPFVGVTGYEGSSVMFEVNGFVGVTVNMMTPVAEGTEVVAHFCNVNALDRFIWMADGEVRLDFEPLFPTRRVGSMAEEVVDLMSDVGFDLGDDDDGGVEEGDDIADPTPRAFALADRLTGVTLTAERFEQSTFSGGIVELRF